MTDELRLAIGAPLFMAIGYLLWRTGVLRALAGPPTARCCDGSLSFSEHRCGTCSPSRCRGGILPSLRLATTTLRRRSRPALDLAPPALA